jgi:hypothetical protein
VASPAALKALLAALKTEQEKRDRLLGRPAGDAREILYHQLDMMAERLRAAPGYVEPDPVRKARMLRDLEDYFAAHYGSQARKT